MDVKDDRSTEEPADSDVADCVGLYNFEKHQSMIFVRCLSRHPMPRCRLFLARSVAISCVAPPCVAVRRGSLMDDDLRAEREESGVT